MLLKKINAEKEREKKKKKRHFRGFKEKQHFTPMEENTEVPETAQKVENMHTELPKLSFPNLRYR